MEPLGYILRIREQGSRPNKAIKGWSKYGTNCYNENDDSYNDVINGAGSKLGYDCTYTVPKGQTKTLFAFTSYSGGRLSNKDIIYDATFGNLLDDINFKLYQPISSSITEGGTGGASAGNVTISSDIKNGNLLYTTVKDGQECTIHTKLTEDKSGHTFQGAYVTEYDEAGNPQTKFVDVYTGDTTGKTAEELLELSRTHFVRDDYYIHEGGETWDYFYTIKVDSPVHIHIMYTKAPYVLYDSNGGEPYQWTEDNSVGGNLVGFRDGFKGLEGVNSKGYYEDVLVKKTDDGNEKITPGFYKSHAALPNEKWNTNTFADGTTVGARFLGWAIKDSNNKLVILNGKHQVTYNPTADKSGHVTFNNLDENGKIIESGAVAGLELDATHGVTLTAQWQFGYTAQAQTLIDSVAKTYENSAVGGWVEETYITTDRDNNVVDYKKDINGKKRIERTDAYAAVGETIIFRANADSANNYVFEGWYTIDENGVETRISTTPNLPISVKEGKSTTYYARFKTKTVPVVFHYSPSGSGLEKDYVYYDADADNKYGKFFQEVEYKKTAKKPTGDSQNVTMWFTSPTERDQEHLFDFSTQITDETHLYASPAFTFNYFNYFKGKEPWFVDVYATLKFKGQYIDMKKDADMTNYNIYMLKGNVGEAAPAASEIKKNSSTKKVSKGNPAIKFNQTTKTGKTFNRAGTTYNDFYIFNMKTPVWVLFDFTYKGITYTSAIKDRSLYNDITVYMQTEKSQLFTTYPESAKIDLINAQNTLLLSIQDMYTAVSQYTGIKEPTTYKNGSPVLGDLPDGEASNTYTFNSTTAIRNIEPWGLKYTFSVDNQKITEFVDYGAVVLTDKSGAYASAPTINKLIKDKNSLMYSRSKGNIYSTNNESVEIYHINDLLATDFDKNTYTVFFVKDSNGTFHYSTVVTNSYNELANAETEDSVQNEINKSITKYSKALIDYYNVKNSNGINN